MLLFIVAPLLSENRFFRIQIHLMLLFIGSAANSAGKLEVFKYISCYCLSQPLRPALPDPLEFKYISCYCLSCFMRSCWLVICAFKYISCYCLSLWTIYRRFWKPIQIHLMLLFIVPGSGKCRRSSRIQIHLMLLFINPADHAKHVHGNSNTSHVIVYHRAGAGDGIKPAFKYISCYCLSVFDTLEAGEYLDSNTSHVIVYPGALQEFFVGHGIQIHLMLLFINVV